MTKYTFDPTNCVVYHILVFTAGTEWLVGFKTRSSDVNQIGSDPVILDQTITAFRATGATLVGWDQRDVLERILGHPLDCDHVDLSARAKQAGEYPNLETIGTNLVVKQIPALPTTDSNRLTADWVLYNDHCLTVLQSALHYFAPELGILAIISEEYQVDLRSTHQAGIGVTLLARAYRDYYGEDLRRLPAQLDTVIELPGVVLNHKPQAESAAARLDRIISEAIPTVNDQPVVPQLASPVEIGLLHLNMGKGGLISVKHQPALYRRTADHHIVELDVSSFYPALMVLFGIAPGNLREVGPRYLKALLELRLGLKARARAAADPVTQHRLTAQATACKIILNSIYGDLGCQYSIIYDWNAYLRVVLSGQYLLLNLTERLHAAGAELLMVHTDGIYFGVERDNQLWRGVLEDWQAETGLTLDLTHLETLIIRAANNYAYKTVDGKIKRRGELRGDYDWQRKPDKRIVADSIIEFIFNDTPPADTINSCNELWKFTGIERGSGNYLIDGEGIAELDENTRWYKSKDSTQRIEHHWVDKQGNRRERMIVDGVRVVRCLPDGISDDLDREWYAAQALAELAKWCHDNSDGTAVESATQHQCAASQVSSSTIKNTTKSATKSKPSTPTTWVGAAPNPPGKLQYIDYNEAARAVDLPALAGLVPNTAGKRLCPAHNDTRPSLSLWSTGDRWRYSCKTIACDIQGDALDWITHTLGVSRYVAAYLALYDDAIPKLKPSAGQPSEPPVHRNPDWQAAIVYLVEEAHKILLEPENAKVVDYLTGRGLNVQTIRRYRLGFLPSGAHIEDTQPPLHLCRGVTIPLLLPGHGFGEPVTNQPIYAGIDVRLLNNDDDNLTAPIVRDDGSVAEKYRCAAGTNRSYPYPSSLLKFPDKPLVLCEGELDCLLARQALEPNYNCYTYGGAAAKPGSVHVPDRFMTVPWFIMMDNDRDGRESAKLWLAYKPDATVLAYPDDIKDFTALHQAGRADDWVAVNLKINMMCSKSAALKYIT